MKIDRKKLHNAYRYVIDWLYPNVCPCCDKLIDYDKDFCDECRAALDPYEGDTPIPYVDRYTAACIYNENIDRAILRFKKTMCGNSYYAFASIIFEALMKCGMSDDVDIIVPIPISKKRLDERGYNQTELISKELSIMMDVPSVNVLMKIRETKMQKQLGKEARAHNLDGAYAIDPKHSDISGKTLLLIDDVSTTGSTFTEAAKVLREHGVGKVYAASVAKTLGKDYFDGIDDDIWEYIDDR